MWFPTINYTLCVPGREVELRARRSVGHMMVVRLKCGSRPPSPSPSPETSTQHCKHCFFDAGLSTSVSLSPFSSLLFSPLPLSLSPCEASLWITG
ncbi:hypothetical protein KC19_11G059800 [Ceratodon purpureus]|uniref:Uncharacterized protein n=1 Tax=Ceratodon purpureus TaxID=3225 RepID=A0A8T0GDV5_CERPU|nr:hypothetical protein KC19_11G059800 [Ceratodon purpureus]